MTERLAWPPSLREDGRLSTVQQDSDDDIRQCVRLVLQHRPGDRTDVPQLGITDLTHAEEIDPEEIRSTVERFEPRAGVAVDVALDEIDRYLTEVTVTYDPLDTNDQER